MALERYLMQAGALAAMLFACATSAAQPLSWPPVGEPSTAARVAGRWLWADLVTSDVKRSREFYHGLFGWEIKEHHGPDGPTGYHTININGRAIGGIVAGPPDAKQGARWIGLASGDPKTMAARAREGGGGVVVAPRSLPGRGELTVLSDPDGADFAVVRADNGDPADHVGGVNEWMWAELWAKDATRAADFYRDVFDYAVTPAEGKGLTGYVLSAGGRARAGVMSVPDASLAAVWIPYVRVDDVGATVKRAVAGGARVVVAPRPHFRSRVAVLVDPMGAPFAVAEWRSK